MEPSEKNLHELKLKLAIRLPVNGIGEATDHFVMRSVQISQRIDLCQKKYVDTFMSEKGLNECFANIILRDTSVEGSTEWKASGDDSFRYKRLICSLRYIATP